MAKSLRETEDTAESLRETEDRKKKEISNHHLQITEPGEISLKNYQINSWGT